MASIGDEIAGCAAARKEGKHDMPIARMLIDSDFTPEQRHVFELAYNNTLRKLDLVDRSDPICEIVARKVIEIGARGATNAVAISEIAFRELGPL